MSELNAPRPPRFRHGLHGLIALLPLLLIGAAARAQPAEHPLMVGAVGAKPILMVTLDNSGSMAFPMQDDYNITQQDYGSGGQIVHGGYWQAMRSSEANPLYYNPRVTYRPRVDALGQPVPVNDGLVFVSNQDSVGYSRYLFAPSRESLRDTPALVVRSDELPRPTYDLAQLQDSTQFWSAFTNGAISAYVPRHVKLTAADVRTGAPPVFSYVVCSRLGFKGVPLNRPDLARNIGGQFCDAGTTVDVVYGSQASIPLPSDHHRSDCGPASCTTAQETANILTWFRYHRDRMSAAATALGLALSDKRLDRQVRIGYLPINDLGSAIGLRPGVTVDKPKVLRGARDWQTGSADNQALYDWLYFSTPFGGTPLHNAIDKVAGYLRVPADALENPWARDPGKPAGATNPEMSCRRAYNLVLSDGGWSNGTATNGGSDDDSQAGKTFTGTGRNGLPPPALAYDPKGSASPRGLYIPYPGVSSGTLADLTAHYHWNEDLRPNLANEVPTQPGKPTFWQNMTTYTVGYMVQPSGKMRRLDGSLATSGLTFEQIDQYRAQFLQNPGTATPPSWPTVTNTAADLPPAHIDDFIQAGYTGGARSFSIYKTEDLLTVFNAILADILNASGNDAGIALGTTSAGSVEGSLATRLRYGVTYRTNDNAGDVTAMRLDAKGEPLLLDQNASGQALSPASTTYWSAQAMLPPPDQRKVYSLDDNGSGFEFKGALTNLPAGIRAYLQAGARAAYLPGGPGFVDYLRGKDPVVDTANQLYRLRGSSRMGAIVNSPPVLQSAAQHLGYDDPASTVSGKTAYAGFLAQTGPLSDTLFVATNAGVVHALDAAQGSERAAYMPRRSMKRLLDQADSDRGFRYVLDGPLSLNDVYDGRSWTPLVVGSGGRGERLVYGLRAPKDAPDTDPLTAANFLWETGPDAMDTANDGDNTPFASGHMTTPARSGQTDSGDWVVVLSSGHYNGQADGGRHGLVVLNALTGAVIRTIALPAAYPAGRGLGGVTLVRDARWRVVAAYAGDANGHLWRFDLRGAPANWKVAYGQPLFTTEHHRPIYGAPAWQAHPGGGTIVVVGTGMLLDDSDPGDTAQRESVYGIWDPTSRQDGTPDPAFVPVTADQLLQQDMLEQQAEVGGNRFYRLTRRKIDWTAHPPAYRGWKFMLGGRYAGERSIAPVVNAGSSVVLTTVVINQSSAGAENCETPATPLSAVYVFNALDGEGKPAFDVDHDGRLDAVSAVFSTTGGFGRGSGFVNRLTPSEMSAAQKGLTRVAGRDGEAPPENTSCLGGRWSIVGLGGALDSGVNCPGRWSRQQYTLTRLPQ